MEPTTQTVACLGSSTTAARGTYDWIAELENRPRNRSYRFVNLGVGGDPDSDDPTQATLNALFADCNQVIREVASSYDAHYIPFYERFVDAVRDAATQKPFKRLSFPALYRDYLFREFVQRRSFDEIARINGWQFHIDGFHLNTQGGTILVDVVQGFLDT